MNKNIEENIEFFAKYGKNFPNARDVQSKKLSDQERFIKQQEPLIDGAKICADYGGYFEQTNFDCSGFSGVNLNIRLMDADCLVYSKSMWSAVKFSLQQEFFNRLFKHEKDVPELTPIRPSDFYGENGKHKELVDIICYIYPVLPLENRNLYKVDVSVEIKGTYPTKTNYKATSDSIVNFVQKHFTVDKEGLTFQASVEEALLDCFFFIKEIFIGTKDKKIYVLKEEEIQEKEEKQDRDLSSSKENETKVFDRVELYKP